ncbi:MAG: hypothetical protein AABZ04_11780, partial [Pseudomonadota bacterium]
TLMAGAGLLAPEIRLDRALAALGPDVQKQVTTRLATWFEAQKQKHLLPLVKMLPQIQAGMRQLQNLSRYQQRSVLDTAHDMIRELGTKHQLPEASR